MTAPDTKTLLAMLGYRRPAGSNAEAAFISRFLAPLGCKADAYGNMILRLGSAPVLWSSHTDTVHRKPGSQLIQMSDDCVITAPRSDCLGADCTAGVWLMVEMIRAGVPGLYIFHREEEVGGCGSSYIASKTPELVDGIKFAIAFDRRGTTSVITHQGRGRCCSDAFASSLIAGLDLGMEHDDGGTFTDTANYVDLVAECTNVSVGFQNEHRSTESLDLGHLLRLRDALLRLDLDRLVDVRKPGEDDDYWNSSLWGDKWEDDEKFADKWDVAPRFMGGSGRTKSRAKYDQLQDLVLEHPDAVADLLDALGVTAQDILSHVYGSCEPWASSDDDERTSAYSS